MDIYVHVFIRSTFSSTDYTSSTSSFSSTTSSSTDSTPSTDSTSSILYPLPCPTGTASLLSQNEYPPSPASLPLEKGMEPREGAVAKSGEGEEPPKITKIDEPSLTNVRQDQSYLVGNLTLSVR